MAAFNPISSLMGAGFNPFGALWAPVLNMALPQPKLSPMPAAPPRPGTPPRTDAPSPAVPSAPSEPRPPSQAVPPVGGPLSGMGGDALIRTSQRGVLGSKPSWLTRKTLLGE